MYTDVECYFMELKGDDMGVLPCDMRCHVLVYAVYGCVICEINAVSNVIQWFLSVSNTNPMAFLTCLSPTPLLTRPS